MEKRFSKPLCILGALLLIASLYALYAIGEVKGLVQFCYPAPAPVVTKAEDGSETTDNRALKEMRQTVKDFLEQLPAVTQSTLSAVCDPVTLEAGEEGAMQSAVARLEAGEDGVYALRPVTLLAGRLIYPDEFKYGSDVILLDEGLAVALFKYAEPIDREVVLAGKTYRVVGIVRAGKRAGDHQEYRCYAPYRSFESTELAMTALTLDAYAEKTSAAYNALKQSVASLSADGTLISLPKEKMNAAMPLRVLGFVAGCALVWQALRLVGMIAMQRYRELKEKLKTKYMVRLLPWTLLNLVPMTLGVAVCVAALAYLFVMMIAPVYTFPEWVPAVLVEPKDISAAFWSVWQTPATVTEYRTPELLRLRFYGTLMGWVCGGLGIIAGAMLTRYQKTMREKRRNDKAKLSA